MKTQRCISTFQIRRAIYRSFWQALFSEPQPQRQRSLTRKSDIYHEFLHHYASLSGMYPHSECALDNGAGDDLFYAFSNKASSPDEKFRGTEMPIVLVIYDAAEQIEPDVRSGYMYSLSPTAPKFLSPGLRGEVQKKNPSLLQTWPLF